MQGIYRVLWRNGGILFGYELWHTGGMEKEFLEHVKRVIRGSPSLSVAGLGELLGKSPSQTYRILRGDGPYHARYTATIRGYVGLGSVVDREGMPTVSIDVVDLRLAESLERETDVICRTTLPHGWLPADVDPKTVKLVRVADDHCAPAFVKGEHAFVDLAQTIPEPSGVFLIWTGMGFKLQHVEHVLGTEPPEVRLTSTNTSVGSTHSQLPLKQVAIMGRLFGSIRINRS